MILRPRIRKDVEQQLDTARGTKYAVMQINDRIRVEIEFLPEYVCLFRQASRSIGNILNDPNSFQVVFAFVPISNRSVYDYDLVYEFD